MEEPEPPGGVSDESAIRTACVKNMLNVVEEIAAEEGIEMPQVPQQATLIKEQRDNAVSNELDSGMDDGINNVDITVNDPGQQVRRSCQIRRPVIKLDL